ncbi:MAG: hypothetical protein PHG27_06440 [Massilibacteroides sp.]|nr:hypothetical protein [Massilibacteroides sp.]MDD4115218.1 hypothetical protein [Massilibacteroides sp.]MDD4660938.1 hypothetical protein [Massilibacteroides sp.]
MSRFILTCLIFLSLSVYSQGQLNTLKKRGENVYISSMIDEYHEINYWFKKCMANDLYTFYRVSITSVSSGCNTIVNEAFSDNIGPFDIQDGGWCGGNHLFTDGKTKTAETFSIKLYADGNVILSDTILKTHTIRIEVENYIFNPLAAKIKKEDKVYFTDTLCIERAIYTIEGNSIQTALCHNYLNSIPVTVLKYYGMQSMFDGEKQLLTPSGEYKSWTDVNSINRFKKKDFPQFNRYIEKNDLYYQSSYLSNEGLGTHDELLEKDVIFIGNSWSKCYHKLLGNVHRVAGDYDSWNGVYTWVSMPLLNTGSAFAYNGSFNGKKYIFFSNNIPGDFNIPIPKKIKNKKINIVENTSNATIKKKNRTIHLFCPLPGSVIVSFE